MIKISVLITCHNRKVKTLKCLNSLYNQFGLNIFFQIDVFLVNDACTDGTPDEIRFQYPQVNIIQGDGNLYWNRGMHLAWKTALNIQDFDYYLWLNDDTFLFENAIKILLKERFPKSIVCGTTNSQLNHNATYGAYISKPLKLLIPNDKYQNADFCNGNCVLIPRIVFQKIGNLDPIFHHALGDLDYSLRARKIGFEIKVAPEFIGTCERNSESSIFYSSSYKLKDRIKYLYSPLCYFHPHQLLYFDRKHNGLFFACFHYLIIHIKVVFPRLWKFLKK